MTDTYAGLPVRRGLFQCDDWQRMAEDLMAFQDAVQEALGTEEAGDVLGAIRRLKADAARAAGFEAWLKTQRDKYALGMGWIALDCALDNLREHFHTGTPVDEEVQGPHVEADR